MSEGESTLLAFLFLKGNAVKKETILKAISISPSELTEITITLKESFRNLPFILIETEHDIELALNSGMTSFFNDYIKKEKSSDLSPGTLQTLTVIAYLDKPSRLDISYIRGVSAKQSLGTLLARGLIEEHDHDRYSLTTEALSYLGVTHSNELPLFVETRKQFLEKINNALSH